MIPPDQHRLGIDHPIVSVQDFHRAYEQYKKLGFAPSPISYHPWGTITCAVMFENNFIELIGVHDPLLFGTGEVSGFCYGRTLNDFLERSEGLGLLALHSKDIEGDFAAVKAAGLEVQQRVDFRRPIKAADGSPDEAVVSLGMVMEPELGDVSNFLCQQHRPHLIWRKEWQNHPNTSSAVDEVVYVCAEPEVLARRWRKLWGDARVSGNRDAVVADTGCGRAVALTLPKAKERFGPSVLPTTYTDKPHGIALQVRVRDISHVQHILIENGVPYVDTRRGVAVAASAAGNTIIEFSEAA